MEKDKDKQICWGIIGAGSVCRVKSAPAMNKIPGSRIAAVMRRTGEKAREFAALHNIPRWYDGADALLSDPDVNAVYIATPPGSHRELTLKAAAAGKSVYVEKPMARNWQECRDMISACKEAGVPLFVAYYRRMLPNYRKIKELVDAGVIGTVRSVHIRMNKPVNPDFDRDPGNWRVQPELAGGGYFYDLASHQLDFLDYLLGPATDACGIASNQADLYPAEDIVTGSFRFESGVQGTGNWCFTAAKSDEEDLITLTGSKGVLRWPTFAGYYVDLKTDAKPDAIRFHFDMPEHIQQPLIETIVRELQDWMVHDRSDIPLKYKAPDSMEASAADDATGEMAGSADAAGPADSAGSADSTGFAGSAGSADSTGFAGSAGSADSGDEVRRCPSTGITAARTNRVMEALTGKNPM